MRKGYLQTLCLYLLVIDFFALVLHLYYIWSVSLSNSVNNMQGSPVLNTLRNNIAYQFARFKTSKDMFRKVQDGFGWRIDPKFDKPFETEQFWTRVWEMTKRITRWRNLSFVTVRWKLLLDWPRRYSPSVCKRTLWWKWAILHQLDFDMKLMKFYRSKLF